MSKRRQSHNNNKDIRSFYPRTPKRSALEPGKESADAQERQFNNQDMNHKPKIKTEEAATCEDGHSHTFLLKFDGSETKYTIQCDRPQTVLEVIKSKSEITAKVKSDDDKIIIQMGKAHRDVVIATHFPCLCLEEGELLTLTERTEVVEERNAKRDYRVYQDEHYFFVYIYKEGGTNTKSKTLLKSSSIKQYCTRLCVYGTANMTLKDAIERDGRFVELGDFKLEDYSNGKVHVFSEDKIQQHKGKTFKIQLEKNNSKRAGDASSRVADEAGPSRAGAAAAGTAGERVDTGEAGPSNAGAAAAPNTMGTTRWVPFREVLKEKEDAGRSEDVKEILNLLRAQFPELKKRLLNRMSPKILKETFKKVDFGKAQQAFSEVGRVRKLFQMADSVCVIACNNQKLGSGFVMFKNYILTNAHLFKTVVHNNKEQQHREIQPDIQVTAMFNYEESDHQNILSFRVKNTFIDYDTDTDYAILELEVSEEDEGPVPPGLMQHCCPMPSSGEACLVGHPGVGVKKFDPTCIIEKENRVSKADKHLEQFKDDMAAIMTVVDHIKNQGIDNILYPKGSIYEKAATYNTFMYHGSSGSPVFDAHCRLFGMHTGGFTYGLITKESVIEYARPVLLIFKQFVTNLRTRNNTELLKAVEEEFKEFPYWKEIEPDEQPMDES